MLSSQLQTSTGQAGNSHNAGTSLTIATIYPAPFRHKLPLGLEIAMGMILILACLTVIAIGIKSAHYGYEGCPQPATTESPSSNRAGNELTTSAAAINIHGRLFSPEDPSLTENSPREALKAKQRARARAQMIMKGMGRH